VFVVGRREEEECREEDSGGSRGGLRSESNGRLTERAGRRLGVQKRARQDRKEGGHGCADGRERGELEDGSKVVEQ